MIRNTVIHLANEQPLLADLYGVPAPTDVGLLCTNLRMMDGKRPVFIDRIESTFFFPYHTVRFLEVPPGELARHQADAGTGGAAAVLPAPPGGAPLPLDDAVRLPVPASAADDGELELDLGEDELDEGLLQRIRDL